MVDSVNCRVLIANVSGDRIMWKWMRTIRSFHGPTTPPFPSTFMVPHFFKKVFFSSYFYLQSYKF